MERERMLLPMPFTIVRSLERIVQEALVEHIVVKNNINIFYIFSSI